MATSLPPGIVAILGSTAAGKGALGRELARRLKLPVFLCDSVKIYRGLDIGSGKPSVQARAEIPHFLLDVCEPDEIFSAGDYATLARKELLANPGLFVGGTGFYLRTLIMSQSGPAELLNVKAEDPERVQFTQVWMARERETPGSLHDALQLLDNATAAAIHPNNHVRLLRALWLCQQLGRPLSQVRQESPPAPQTRLLAIMVDPPPETLRQQVAQRLQKMFEQGFVEEVEGLLARGFTSAHKAMQSLGYKQVVEMLAGGATLAQTKTEIFAATWAYARRQRTYFAHQLPYHQLLPGDAPVSTLSQEISRFLQL